MFVCGQASMFIWLINKTLLLLRWAVQRICLVIGMTTWEQRCKPVVSKKARLKVSPAMWAPKHRRKAIKTSQQIRGLKGGSGRCRVYRILPWCDGCSVMSLLCRMTAEEFNASHEVVVAEFDPICQQFV